MDKQRRSAVVVMLACAIGTVVPAGAAEQTVSMVDRAFDPQGLEVDEGDTIVWTNDGSEDHTVTADDGSVDSGPLDPGDTFTIEDVAAGTLRYHCSIHGAAGGTGMAGVLFVAGTDDRAGEDEPATLATTGGSRVPPGAFAFFALTILALGWYLRGFERLVYPERFR